MVLEVDEVVHLYAVWKPAEFSKDVNGMTVTHCPATKTVTVSVPRGWDTDADCITAAVYGTDETLRACSARSVTTAAFRLTLTYGGEVSELRLFLTDEDFCPTEEQERVSLTELS